MVTFLLNPGREYTAANPTPEPGMHHNIVLLSSAPSTFVQMVSSEEHPLPSALGLADSC